MKRVTKKLSANYYVVVDSTPGTMMLHKPINTKVDMWNSFFVYIKGGPTMRGTAISANGNILSHVQMAYDTTLGNGNYPLRIVPIGSVIRWVEDDVGFYAYHDCHPRSFNWALHQETIDKIVNKYGTKK